MIDINYKDIYSIVSLGKVETWIVHRKNAIEYVKISELNEISVKRVKVWSFLEAGDRLRYVPLLLSNFLIMIH